MQPILLLPTYIWFLAPFPFKLENIHCAIRREGRRKEERVMEKVDAAHLGCCYYCQPIFGSLAPFPYKLEDIQCTRSRSRKEKRVEKVYIAAHLGCCYY